MIHEPYFVLPDGTSRAYFKTTIKRGVPTVIQNPYFSFDFQGYDICREEYRFNLPNNSFLKDFITECELNSGLRENEALWHSTGYWSIKNGDELIIGIGPDTLDLALFSILSGRLVVCLESNDFCIFIKYDINVDLATVVLDIFASTTFRPWVEILEPFRKTLSRMLGDRFDKTIDTKAIVHSSPFRIKGDGGLLFPYAISPTHNGWIGPSIIPNRFGFIGVGGLFTQARGGWMKHDFFKPSNYFSFGGNVHLFDDVLVVRGLVDHYPNCPQVNDKRLSLYRNIVDMFPA